MQLQHHTKDIDQRLNDLNGRCGIYLTDKKGEEHFKLDNETVLHLAYNGDNGYWNFYEFTF